MGDIILPRRMFLWCMAVIYLAAFLSLYVQIPGEPRILPAGRTQFLNANANFAR